MHRKSHFGIMLRQAPWLMIENIRRPPCLLHLTNNGIGNTATCTVEATPYDLRGGKYCHRRRYANLRILKPARIKYRFREKPPGKGAKPRRPPQGPDARKFMQGDVILKLHQCFFPDEAISSADADALAGAARQSAAAVRPLEAERRRTTVRAKPRGPRPTAGESGQAAAAASPGVLIASDCF